MKRREFLHHATAGAAGASLAACSRGSSGAGATAPAVHTAQRVRWRLTSSFPRSLDTIYGCAEVLAENLAAMTDGRFELRVYPAGEIVPGLQVLDAVQGGSVQVGQTCSYYYTGKSPALAFDTCVPFGLTARQQNAWLLEGGGGEVLDDLFDEFDVLSIPSGNTGAQMGGWFKREIGGPEDLKGLKMRIPGMGGQVMSRLGVSVQVIAGGEIYTALERGAIDATEWVGPADDEKLGFHKVAKHYYYPGWWEPGASLSLYVNRPAWAKLPVSYQAAFRAAALAAGATMQQRYDALNPPALERILATGVQMRPFADELLRAARDASLALLDQHAGSDARFRKVYEHWKLFRDASFRWFGTSELAYARFMFGE